MIQKIAVATVAGLTASILGSLIEKAVYGAIKKGIRKRNAKEDEWNYLATQRGLIPTEFVD